MNGWKTNTGATAAAVVQLLVVIGIIEPQTGEALTTIAAALVSVGIGSKLQRILDKQL